MCHPSEPGCSIVILLSTFYLSNIINLIVLSFGLSFCFNFILLLVLFFMFEGLFLTVRAFSFRFLFLKILSLLSSHSLQKNFPLSCPFRAMFLYLCFVPDIPIYSFKSSQLFSSFVTFAFSFLKNLPVIVMNQKRLLEKLPLSING